MADVTRMLAAFSFILCLMPGGAGAGEPARGDAMTVSTIRAASHCFARRISASGTFVARRDIALRPDQAGLVVADVAVEPGDHVAKDQVLAHLSGAQAQEPVAVKAPAAGVVVAADAIIGAYTSPQSDAPLFRIAGDGDVELVAEVLATDVAALRQGMPAKIHVVGGDDIEGHVDAVDTSVEARSQLGRVHLAPKADAKVLVGTFARAEIDAGRDCGLMVPLSALLVGTESPVIGLVQEDRVVMHAVKTGLLEGGQVEIRDGLSENDQVIARAGPFLREGDRVVAVPEGR